MTTVRMCAPSHYEPLACSSAIVSSFIQSMGTAEHQPRVGDKRSSASPAARRRPVCHDTHKGCKSCELRRLSIYAFTPESTS